jgi:hypothetical protein
LGPAAAGIATGQNRPQGRLPYVARKTEPVASAPDPLAGTIPAQVVASLPGLDGVKNEHKKALAQQEIL